jgi:hypothetical protein
LEEAADRLTRPTTNGELKEEYVAICRNLLATLTPLEPYWAGSTRRCDGSRLDPRSSRTSAGFIRCSAITAASTRHRKVRFVTPYPPGFPVLVPGQVFSREILSFIRDLDTPEIHGYQPEFGYRVYTEKAIEMCRPANPPVTNGHQPMPAEPPEPAQMG